MSAGSSARVCYAVSLARGSRSAGDLARGAVGHGERTCQGGQSAVVGAGEEGVWRRWMFKSLIKHGHSSLIYILTETFKLNDFCHTNHH